MEDSVILLLHLKKKMRVLYSACSGHTITRRPTFKYQLLLLANIL